MSIPILILMLIVREQDDISSYMRIYSCMYLLAFLITSANLEVDLFGGKTGYLWIDIPTWIFIAWLFSRDIKLARSIYGPNFGNSEDGWLSPWLLSVSTTFHFP
jgi:hypothetical protein